MDTKWTRIIYILGIIALKIGAIDPLEGSVLITRAVKKKRDQSGTLQR